MKKYLIHPGSVEGEITITSSKSHTLRAILFGSMAKGKTTIHHYLTSPDTKAMIEACRLLGAKIDVYDNYLTIDGLEGKIQASEDVIHAGNSGLVLRFISAIGSLAKNPVVVTGDHSIRHQRPMKELLSGLSQLGVSAKSMRGDHYAPVIIQGPLSSGSATISGEDSQPVSALLIVSAFAEGPIEIDVKNAGEKPWVALTLDWLNKFGISCTNNSFQHYKIKGNAKIEKFEYTVPGDLSSAAFPVAAAIVTNSELTIKNVDMNDLQGDKELIYTLIKMGARIDIDEKGHSLHVRKNKGLKGITADINNYIDAVTILAVVACFAEGKTEIKNASIARHKECNRLESIVRELGKMGANIQETAEGLLIEGAPLKGATLNSYNDHRMAMSLSIAALGAKGSSMISPVECVAKTYPGFVGDLNTLGANILECEH